VDLDVISKWVSWMSKGQAESVMMMREPGLDLAIGLAAAFATVSHGSALDLVIGLPVAVSVVDYCQLFDDYICSRGKARDDPRNEWVVNVLVLHLVEQ
jgi:hypothetical protein